MLDSAENPYSHQDYKTTGPESGVITTVDFPIHFHEFEPIVDTLTVGQRTFITGTPGAQAVHIGQGGGGTVGMSTIDDMGAGAFERMTFKNPLGAMEIDAGDGDDTIVIGALDELSSGGGDTTIVGGDGANTVQSQPGAIATVNEGDQVALNLAGYASDLSKVQINWDDGSVPSSGSLIATHVYADNGSRLVTVTGADLPVPSTRVIVQNVVPTVRITAFSPSIAAVGTPVTFSADLEDPGVQDTHEATWVFTHMVGTSQVPQVFTGTVVAGRVEDVFSFTTSGVYHVESLKVTDDDGAESNIATTDDMLVICDASAGFVTGNGWIASPPGAYVANPSLAGKATFGFVSKYQKGAKVPMGVTEFQFKVADLNFHSSTYDWLVMAGARAQYKGSGTINGEGSYSFMLTAIDGQVNGGGGSDKFRMKIWDKASAALVYDNQLGASDEDTPSTVLGGGSIAIHKDAKTRKVADERVATMLGDTLALEQLTPMVEQAVGYWVSQADDAEVAQILRGMEVQIADLPGSMLALASSSNLIWIDRDAAGYGWQVDAAGGGMDLLTVIVHEFGHRLGLDDDVMGSELAVGQRRLPTYTPLIGDANRDSVFDRMESTHVLQAAKYLTGRPAVWSEGDWSGDGTFDQEDIVAALQSGSYLQGPYAAAAADGVFAAIGP